MIRRPLARLVRRLLRRPAPDFADVLRRTQQTIDPVPVRVSILERALVSKHSNAFPRTGAK